MDSSQSGGVSAVDLDGLFDRVAADKSASSNTFVRSQYNMLLKPKTRQASAESLSGGVNHTEWCEFFLQVRPFFFCSVRFELSFAAWATLFAPQTNTANPSCRYVTTVCPQLLACLNYCCPSN